MVVADAEIVSTSLDPISVIETATEKPFVARKLFAFSFYLTVDKVALVEYSIGHKLIVLMVHRPETVELVVKELAFVDLFAELVVGNTVALNDTT